MRIIINDSKDKEKTFQSIGKLVSSGNRDLLVLYDTNADLKKIEMQLLLDFGESILESGIISFQKKTSYKKEKGDMIINSENTNKITP